MTMNPAKRGEAFFEQTDPVHEEFTNLSALALEFYVIDRSVFPFRPLDGDGIRDVYGYLPCNSREYAETPFDLATGNYAAGYILCNLRKQTRSNVHRFKNLQALFDLPTEVVLEIFQHLHPIDLYSMIRTTKELRSLLLSRKSSNTWHEAFLQHPDIPSCPFDVSFPKWTSLLFGPATCDQCGYPGAMPDIAFRIRRCCCCMSDIQEAGRMLNVLPEIYTMIPHTYKYDAINYPDPSETHWDSVAKYLLTDAHAMGVEVLVFLSDIAAKIPGSEENYEKFRKQTELAIATRMEHTRTTNLWFRSIAREIASRFEGRKLHVHIRIEYHLLKIGCSEEDLVAARSDIVSAIYHHHISRMNGKVFLKYISEFRTYVEIAKQARLEREHKARMIQCEGRIAEVYDKFKKSVDPFIWESLPHLDRICHLRPIYTYIHSADIQALDEDSAYSTISSFVDTWLAYGKRHLLDLLPQEFESIWEEVEEERRLDLAMAVFVCPLPNHTFVTSRALIGWRDVACHLNCVLPDNLQTTPSLPFIFHVNAAKAAMSITSRLCLDLSSTMASDLDSLNLRLGCTDCRLTRKRGSRGRQPLTWREYIHRVITKPSHNGETFKFLSEDAVKSVMFHEGPYPHPGDRSWLCRHCPIYLNHPGRRKDVFGHLTKTHQITNPIINVDYFHRIPEDWRGLFFLSLDPPVHYRCSRCPEATKVKLWSLKALLAHLADKHEVRNAEEGNDYHLLEIYSAM